MKAILNEGIQIVKDTTNEKILHQIRMDLTYQNPDFTQKSRYDYYLGDTKQHLTSYEETDEILYIPRGYANNLAILSQTLGFELQFEDQRVFFDMPIKTNSNFRLRPYQASAKKDFLLAQQGVIVIPCGGGKTVVALSIIDKIKQPTLIIVHTIDLLNQWKDNLQEKLGIKHIGVISGKEEDVQDITVATIQSLRNHHLLPQITTRFGMVILDEAHHVPADTFRMVLNQFKAKFRLGLSATPNREDGLTELLFHTIGRKVYEIDYPYLIDNGFLIKPTYKVVKTTFDYSPKKLTPSGKSILDWHKMSKRLISDFYRNEQIYSTIRNTHVKGRLALVLSGRVDHLKLMAEELNDDYRCAILVGTTKKKDRIDILNKAREGKIDIIFSANVSDEGLDMPNLERVYLTFPNKSEAKIIQRIGRILRPYPTKETAEVYDFVDNGVSALYRQARKRINIFKQTFGRYTNGEF